MDVKELLESGHYQVTLENGKKVVVKSSSKEKALEQVTTAFASKQK